jgi:hypothetical protein
MGFRKDEAGGEEAPAFSDQAVTDGQCLSMVGVIMLWSRKNGHPVKPPEHIFHSHWD